MVCNMEKYFCLLIFSIGNYDLLVNIFKTQSSKIKILDQLAYDGEHHFAAKSFR